MKIVRIFVSEKSNEGLWSIHLNGEALNEFDKFFRLMDDLNWLDVFFVNNEADLYSGYFGPVTISSAALRTMDEADEMEDKLYDFSEKGFTGSGSLQYFFKPLNNFEYSIIVHQKSKARIRKSWLRVYAIRLAENCFVVTGGAIKLTADMKRVHLQKELMKLEQAKTFLRDNGINNPEDLNTYFYG